MNIRWAPNPLQTVVELDEADKRLFRQILKTQDFEDRIASAYFDLDPEHQEMFARPDRPTKSLDERVKEALYELDLDYILDGKERGGKTFDAYLDDRATWFIQDLAGEHDGDCVCVACSCSKCYAERLLGIDTIEGLGKHEASKIGGYFKEGANLDEVIQRLRDYVPTYKYNPRWPEEEWKIHVPRWIQEGRRAYEWLEAYRREHFS